MLFRSGATRTITVVASGQGAVTIAPSGTFSIGDTAGNATTTAGGTDRTVTFDSVAPTLTLEQATGQADPAKNSAISFTLSANEALDGATITASDFTVTNGSTPVVTGSGTTWTITTTATADGNVAIAPSGTFSDRKSTRLNSSHMSESRMPSSA